MTSPVWMEGCVSALAGLSAVIFIPDDTPKTGFSRPMMLQNIMGGDSDKVLYVLSK